ncbi:MAG TPA: hypothetical protein VFG14_18780 [Chthoniobacteraceae bacterium]|nr:hypothetical protein [Chthoniobacteraceae bacterium]
MNTTILRAGAAVLLLGGVWGFGYFVGSDHPSSTPRTFGGSSSTTPYPDSIAAPEAAKLSSTAIGRLIEGKSDYRKQTALYSYAESLDASKMPGAVNEAMQLPIQHRNAALAVLFARWAELDPEAAAKYANLLPKSANPAMLRRAAMTAWTEKDMDGALAWARSLEKGEARNDTLSLIAGALAKRDPNAAMQMVKDNFAPREAGSAYESVFAAWAESDFAAAMVAAQGITDPQLRARVLRATLSKRTDSDPKGVLEAVRTSKVSDLRWNVGNNALNRWMERDLTAARDYVLGLPNGEMREMQVRQVAQEMARRDPQEALTWIDSIPEGDREEAIEGLFSSWANKDPNAAIQAARALPEGRVQENAIAQLVQNLIESDSTTALELLKDLPEGAARQNALSNVSYRWARIDPQAAANWYITNVPENQRGSMHQIMWEWSRSDPEAAMKWAIELPEGDNKGQILGQVFSQMSRNDPAAAAAQIEKLPPESQRNAVSNFISNWAHRDPEAAVRWAATLRDESSKNTAYSNVASQWGQRDPISAARWLEKLPVGQARDAAVSSFSYAASQSDPEGAVAWAVTIRNPDQQQQTIRNVYSNWIRRDPTAAGSWLQSANTISAEFRTELQGMSASPAKKVR